MLTKSKIFSKVFNKCSFASTKLIFGDQARKLLHKGITDVAKVTKVTLGPKGKNVAIENEVGLPRITKDGVTVAKNVTFGNRAHEAGAALLKRVSHSTNVFAGDGTTTSTLLASSIVDEGMKIVSQGFNSINVKNGINKAKDRVIEYLDAIKKDVETKEDLYHVALVSTNYDEYVSELLAEAVHKTGKNGVVHIEPNVTFDTGLMFTEGATLNRGYASPEFLKEGNIKIEMSNPFILTADLEIEKLKQILPLLDKVKKLNVPLFIVTKGIANECLSNILYNHVKGIIDVCVITVPGMGSFTRDMIEDISIITGSYLFDENNADELLECDIEKLGRAKKVVCSQAETFFIGSGGKEEVVNKRIESIKYQLESSEKVSQSQSAMYKDRISRLNGKLAILLCGGNSDIEIAESYDKIVDALNSLKNAMRYGILPGGGAALIYASKILDYFETDNFEEAAGAKILQQALRKPLEMMASNGELNGKYIVKTLLNNYDDNVTGYDLNSEQFVNMYEKGVIDSYNVVRTALEDACSIGGMLLTTEAAIIQEIKYKATPLKYYPKEIF